MGAGRIGRPEGKGFTVTYEEYCALGYDPDEERGGGRLATDAEAHVEWHLNSGVPMGEPCPWDACHSVTDDEYYEMLAEQEAHETWLGKLRELLATGFNTHQGSVMLSELISGAEQ